MPEEQKTSETATINIPQFMTEDNNTFDNESIRQNAGKLYRLMIGISSVWLLIVAVYITQFFGWSNLFLMMPDEFGGFLAGVTLPLVVIWMAIAYIDRGASFKQEAKLLHAYMNQLVYPEDGAAQTTKAMTDAIRVQVIELQQVTKLAAEETSKIKTELSQHVSDFSKLVGILQGYSGTTITELNDSIKIMSQGLDYINDKVNNTSENIEKRISDFSKIANDIKTDMEGIDASMNNQLSHVQNVSTELNKLYDGQNRVVTLNSEVISNCSNKLNNDFANINDFIEKQTGRLEKISAQIFSNYQDIYARLDEKSNLVEKSFSEQTNQLLDYIQNLDKTSLMTSEKFDKFRSNLNQDVDSIISRSKTIADCVGLQVQDLSELTNTFHLNMDSVEQHIDNKIKTLQLLAQTASADIIQAADAFAEKISDLHQTQNTVTENAKVLYAELEQKSNDLTNNAQSAQMIVSNLCERISTDIGGVTASSETLIASLKNAETQIGRQSSVLQDATETLNTQSKLSSSVIEQQQKLLTTAQQKIENGKDVLKQQMDDLLRMANSIDDETVNALKHMNTELSNSIQKSTEIVKNTTAVSTQLKTQSDSLTQVSEKTLAKIADFTSNIRENQNALKETMQDIVTRAENVANLLETQIKAVNAASNDTTNNHNKLIELFNQQSSILNNTAENTVHYVADMVQSFDEKAETINLLFKNQQSEFFAICDKLSANTNNINNILKGHISLLEQSSDRVFSRMSGVEEEFTLKSGLLTANYNQTIDKLLNVNEILNQQNQEFEQSVMSLNGKIKTTGEEVSKIINDFSTNLQTIKEESTVISNEIMANCDKLKESGTTLLTDSRNITQSIEGQVKGLDDSIDKIKWQSEQINANFNKQKDSITDVVNLVSTQTRLGEASMAQQYKYLSDTADNISAKMKEIENLYNSNTASVFETSGKIAFELNTLSDRIIKTGEDVQKTAKQSVTDIEAVGTSLNNSAENLVDTVSNAQQKIDGVMSTYQNYIAGFNTVTAEASSGIVEVNNLISHQNDKMIKISEDTKNLVESFNVVLNEASNQLSKRANKAFEQIKAISTQLKELGFQLEDSTQLTAKHMDNAGVKMRASIKEIATNAERISNDILSSGEVFLKQSGVLLDTTSDTLNKVNAAMDALKAGSENLTLKGKMWLQQSDEFTKVFERQSEIIDTTSLKAADNLSKLERKYQEVQTDNFLKDAAVLFEKMETVAIDINRIFNPTTEEEIWKKYYSGDSSAFVRYLSKVMTKNQIGVIRKEYEENPDFRSLVNRYVADFEMLISKAKGNERAGVLLSVISGSDVGKVYYVIAKALDKLN